MSRRALQIFVVASCLLAPWILLLSRTLPASHLEHKWNPAWVGFDGGLWLALALTAYAGWRRSEWVVIAATVSGTLLMVDAWFDIMTAGQGWEYLMAYLAAFFVELPLAALAFWTAYRVVKRHDVVSAVEVSVTPPR